LIEFQAMVRRLLPLAAALVLSAVMPLRAAKLDLSANASLEAASWANLDFASADRSNRAYFNQNATLGLILKDIRYRSTDPDAKMTIGVIFGAVGFNTKGPLPQPFATMADFYPNSDFTPWLKGAYVNANGLFGRDISLTAGRQQFNLATGMTLSDNDIGMPGFNIRYDNALTEGLAFGAFAFQPKASDTQSGDINVAGGMAQYSSQGLWQIYSFCELDQQTTAVMSTPVDGVIRNFTGISYSMRYKQLSFDAEAALEKGTAKGAAGAGDITFNSNALMFAGKWNQPMGRFGMGAARITAGRASGDDGSSPGTDRAFFPSFGRRYNGFKRAGFGEVFGASLYDAFGGDSSTKTGMPAGLSGIQVISLGASLSPFAGLNFDADVFFFEAAASASGQKQLGSEWDFKLYTPMSSHLDIRLVYGVFSPGAAYPANTPSPSKLAFEVSAKF